MNLNGAIFESINGDLAGRFTALDDIMKFAAQYLIFIMAAIVVASWFARFGSAENRRVAVYSAVIAAAIGIGVAAIVSAGYDHPRPFVNRTGVVLLINHGADPSFPSDHATVAFALAAAMGLYRPRFGIVLLRLALLIGFARVFVGVHYPGDIAGGAVIGIGAAFAVWIARPLFLWLDRTIVQRIIPAQLPVDRGTR